jgi:protein-S-isoprenylcysteine O-methyltransferase Ste14
MPILDIVLIACWIAFWGYWIVAAWSSRSGRRPGGRAAVIRLAIILLAAILEGVFGFRANPWGGNLVLTVVGVALFGLGLAFAIWARVRLAGNWGMPMSRRDKPELVTTGPYRRVRHPIYTGVFAALVGTSLATGIAGLIPTAVIFAYFVFSATQEETFLAEEFPETFPPYKRATKMLVPFVF